MDVGDYLGVTPPISLQEPTEAEKETSLKLTSTLDELGVSETAQGHQHRY